MLLQIARQKLIEKMENSDLVNSEVAISCPVVKDNKLEMNPLAKNFTTNRGNERIIEASLRGKKGQAFCDSYFNYSGRVGDILELDFDTNAKRAIFVSTLNVLLSLTDDYPQAIHCTKEEKVICGGCFSEFIKAHFVAEKKLLLVGYQSEILKAIIEQKETRVSEINPALIGTLKNGVLIDGPEKLSENLEWADVVIATGSTVVNETIDEILNGQANTYLFGVTISGIAKLLNLNHFCYIVGST